MHHHLERPLAGAAVEAVKAARGLFERARGNLSQVAFAGACTRSRLAGGSVLVAAGVGRELLDLADARIGAAKNGRDRQRWTQAAARLRRTQRERSGERVTLPSDTQISMMLAVELEDRASKERLTFCSAEAATRAVSSIVGDCVRRDLGLF